MQLLGFLVFLAAVPLAGLGLCDPNQRRGDLVALMGLAALPGGLILAAL
jgi:hypothetical protein